MQWIHVRLDGPGGTALPKPQLESVYASTLDFEPDERRQRILPDGTVELAVTRTPYMVHAKINRCCMAISGSWPITWVKDIRAASWILYPRQTVPICKEAKTLSEGIVLSPTAQGHLYAAQELTHLADRGVSTPENRLYALSHAIYAAEAALFESAQQKAFAAPRDDLLLGCNFARFTTPGAQYAKFFAQAFDFATLPFYAGRTVPEKNRYDYAYIDAALDFLQSKNITPKGYPLWFGHQSVNPPWLFLRRRKYTYRNYECIDGFSVGRGLLPPPFLMHLCIGQNCFVPLPAAGASPRPMPALLKCHGFLPMILARIH